VKVVGYARRSRERHNGFGLEEQEDRIRRWADYREADVVAILRDDDTSGIAEPEQRPGLGEALRLLREGDADALVVAKFDRLSRSVHGFSDVLRASEREGWKLVCLDPEVDFTTAIGRGWATMLTVFADIEREAFVNRMRGGRAAKQARGGYVGGHRLHRRYGYRLVEHADGKRDYEPVPAEQRAIAEIRKLRDGGMTLQQVGEELERRGVPGPTGNGWNRPTLHRILKREVA